MFGKSGNYRNKFSTSNNLDSSLDFRERKLSRIENNNNDTNSNNNINDNNDNNNNNNDSFDENFFEDQNQDHDDDHNDDDDDDDNNNNDNNNNNNENTIGDNYYLSDKDEMEELEETVRLMDFLPTPTVSDYNINKKVDAYIYNFLKVNNDEASDDDNNNDVNSMLFYEGPFTSTDFYSEFDHVFALDKSTISHQNNAKELLRKYMPSLNLFNDTQVNSSQPDLSNTFSFDYCRNNCMVYEGMIDNIDLQYLI